MQVCASTTAQQSDEADGHSVAAASRQSVGRWSFDGRDQKESEDEYGRSGKHGGAPFGPASRVAQVAADAPGVERRYFDTGGLQFDIGEVNDVEAGYSLCAIFRFIG